VKYTKHVQVTESAPFQQTSVIQVCKYVGMWNPTQSNATL